MTKPSSEGASGTGNKLSFLYQIEQCFPNAKGVLFPFHSHNFFKEILTHWNVNPSPE